jgi:hypothetical protein
VLSQNKNVEKCSDGPKETIAPALILVWLFNLELALNFMKLISLHAILKKQVL